MTGAGPDVLGWSSMTAAHPLQYPADDLDVGTAGDFSEFSPEGQMAIAAALGRVGDGTIQAVPHEEVLAHLERERLKTG